MDENKRYSPWQAATILLMVLGYSGYYLCRSDLSVATPQIIEWLSARGMSAADAKIKIGWIVSISTLAYAIGKFISGGLADYLGGRANFLIGMAGAVLFTLLFALGGTLPIFTIAWIGNRAIQSMGWVGMIKISSRWFAYSTYGTVMGLISLSYLFGDAASRQFMSVLIKHGLTWQQIFFVAAGVLAVIFVCNLIFLREAPSSRGMPEPESNPINVYGANGEKANPPSFSALVLPLLRSPAFIIVCLLSLGFTLLRETFNTWTPTYLTEAFHMTKNQGASSSAWFPLTGGISVVLAGFLSDRFGKSGRAMIILIGLILTTIALLLLANIPPTSSQALPVWLISVIAFVMIGPYSYLAGAVSLDFGGKQGSATACGIIDGVGYLGGVLAGERVARISVLYGWKGAFEALAGVAALSCVTAVFYMVNQMRRSEASPLISIRPRQGAERGYGED